MKEITRRFDNGKPALQASLQYDPDDDQAMLLTLHNDQITNWALQVIDSNSDPFCHDQELMEVQIETYGRSEALMMARTLEWAAYQIRKMVLDDCPTPKQMERQHRFALYMQDYMQIYHHGSNRQQAEIDTLVDRYHVTPLSREQFHASRLFAATEWDLDTDVWHEFVIQLYNYITGQSTDMPVWQDSSDYDIGGYTMQQQEQAVTPVSSVEQEYDNALQAKAERKAQLTQQLAALQQQVAIMQRQYEAIK